MEFSSPYLRGRDAAATASLLRFSRSFNKIGTNLGQPCACNVR